MKIILTSLNAKFIHSNLALFSLKKCAKEFEGDIKILEFTINNSVDYIFEELVKEKADIIGFSCYIWNIEIILEICQIIKKVEPNITIFLGGPEVSFDEKYFMQKGYIDFIISGEGEVALYKFLESYKEGNFENVPSLTYKNKNQIITNKLEEFIDLDNIPFPYSDLKEFENRILYYESQRGCPYNCQYCLSSGLKGMRFLSYERIKKDLQFFLDNGVMQVKFIDRTFNANKEFAYSIWKYLIENDNGITNFHFEISADILDDELLLLIKNARKGLFQFEIGVQSTNEETIERIDRVTNLDKIFKNVKTIKSYCNIHMHLDLIVGLPLEDYKSFKKSFDDVFVLNPEMLQVGFLKLLRGSGLRRDADNLGIVYRDKAPYEVLYTNELSYLEVLELKGVEEMVEKFYNSGQFVASIKFLIRFFSSPFDFFLSLWNFYVEKGLNRVSCKKQYYYAFLKEFYEEIGANKDILDFLLFDMYSNENVKTLIDELAFYHDINKNDFLENFVYLKEKGYANSRIIRSINVVKFKFDMLKFYNTGILESKDNILLFDYSKEMENNISNAYIFEG